MENEKLKVGDKVYFANHRTRHTSYTFQTVKRLTPTQAILENDRRLKNEPSKDWQGNTRFVEIGDRDSWYRVTDKVLQDYEAEKYRQKVSSWFFNQKFTDEQKQQIYNLFNPIK